MTERAHGSRAAREDIGPVENGVVRVAAIDCGTNSIRLLVADLDPAAGTLADVDRRMEVVRLGEGVDRTGRLSAAALQRTLAATVRYGEVARGLGASRVRFVATSATRDAENRREFVEGVLRLLGVPPEVVAGHEEADLSFVGATRELLLGASSAPGGRFGSVPAHEPPFLVVDLGGGSTEVVLGERSVEAAHSVDVGCVRLTERHLHSDPPTAAEIAAASDDVAAALDDVGARVPLGATGTLVGLAGSVTTVTALALDLPRYDSAVIHRSTLPVRAVQTACDRLIGMTRTERSGLPFMHPGRVDVIGAGALIWRLLVDRVVQQAGIEQVVTSEHDILDGIAWSLVDRNSAGPVAG